MVNLLTYFDTRARGYGFTVQPVCGGTFELLMQDETMRRETPILSDPYSAGESTAFVGRAITTQPRRLERITLSLTHDMYAKPAGTEHAYGLVMRTVSLRRFHRACWRFAGECALEDTPRGWAQTFYFREGRFISQSPKQVINDTLEQFISLSRRQK